VFIAVILASDTPASGLAPTTGISVGATDREVRIEASSQTNEVKVTSAGTEQLRVEDTRGATSTSGCAQVDPTKVRCPTRRWILYSANGGGDTAVFRLGPDSHAVALGDGGTGVGASDHFEIEAGSRARAGFTGYRGNDTLIGGSSRLDALFGGRGDDRLVGRERADRLVGSQGTDAYLGGRGNDRVVATDGSRDRIIHCGPGKDEAVLDPRGLDPNPRSCESVTFRPARD
jgi:hypothetical protein